jgi:NAD+ diphosphatase
MSTQPPLALTVEDIDRSADRRGEEAWLVAAFDDPDSGAVLVNGEGPLLDGNGQLLLLAPRAARAAGAAGEPLFLGVRDTRALFALDVPAGLASEHLPAGARFSSLREAAAELPPGDGGLAAHACALAGWHRIHPFCARCGSPTVVAQAGYERHCLAHGHVHHPRTDPVVIMLVSDGERALLGRQREWPAGRYSALAGFVEPGESLEAAVAREIREEACLEVDELSYAISQPWPFPASLMLAFHARWAGGEPRIGDAELEDVRWFTRAQLNAGEIVLPPPLAVARLLIDQWLASGPAKRASGRKVAGTAAARW